MSMLSIQSSAADLKAFQAFAQLVPKAAAAAQRRAINKTLGWLRTHIARAVSRQERIALAAVRQRLRTYPVTGGAMSGKLWFGLNAMDAARIGRVRQNKSGVSVAGRQFRGAFYKKVYGNEPKIWIRAASKHYSDETYAQRMARYATQTGWIAENHHRFPLAGGIVPFEEARPHFDSWVRRADERLLVVLEQELNFELQKYLKGNAHVR